LKRVELLLRAVPLVLAAEPQASFVVIGGGDPTFEADYPAELHALADEFGITDAVTFTGHVADAGALIDDLDLLVNTAQREPFGLIYLEGMARRVAVVAPRSGGSAEIIRHEVDGLLVDEADVDQLAAAIAALLRDPARRQRMGAAGRERVLEHFTVARMAQEAWRVAAEAAQHPRAGRRRRGPRARS
jgi:glycosyltransferase involved in cell wall biosynthesis